MKKRKILELLIILIFGAYFWGEIFSKNRNIRKENNFNVLPIVLDKKLNVAVMADIHGDTKQLEKMLLKARDNGAELIIIAGDIIEREEKDSLRMVKTILDQSGLEYAVIPGDREKNLNNFNNVFGRDYQTIEMGMVKFILINNASWQGLGEEQKRWIEAEVSECQEKICLAVMHKPLNNLFSVKVMGEGNEKVAAEARWLREILIASGVERIEAADLHYSTSYELEGMRTDIVGAISREDNLQSSRYTELMISENSIERRVVEEENDTGN
ncbi:MAG: metallophosphoesterase [Patescibacteria group bacterium]|jgi:hypothetical protein|nr:metallophosphoesterase [Candidatus Shapirobacteria bacterium]